MTTPALDADYIHEVANDVARIDALIADLKEQRDAHMAIIEQAHTAEILTTGKNTFGDVTVTVRNGARRLDTRKIEDLYPYSQAPELYEPKLDTKRVRGAFAPNQLAAWETQAAPTITIKASA